jgi:hypothetical protein
LICIFFLNLFWISRAALVSVIIGSSESISFGSGTCFLCPLDVKLSCIGGGYYPLTDESTAPDVRPPFIYSPPDELARVWLLLIGPVPPRLWNPPEPLELRNLVLAPPPSFAEATPLVFYLLSNCPLSVYILNLNFYPKK